MSSEYPAKAKPANAKKKANNPFDESAFAYDVWFDKEGKLIFDIEINAFQSILSILPKPWLEIGSGSGRFAQALGIDAGIEPSINMVQMARKREINTFWGKGEQKLFDEESFGTIFLITTLCFLDSPVNVLKEASRILIPGGKIVLGIIPRASPWGQYYHQKKLAGHPIYQNATFYRVNQVTQMTIESGFMGERIISTLFQKPGEVLQMEQPREGFYSEAGFVIIVAEKQNTEVS
jgi:SAM-dependent methyltransferase